MLQPESERGLIVLTIQQLAPLFREELGLTSFLVPLAKSLGTQEPIWSTLRPGIVILVHMLTLRKYRECRLCVLLAFCFRFPPSNVCSGTSTESATPCPALSDGFKLLHCVLQKRATLLLSHFSLVLRHGHIPTNPPNKSLQKGVARFTGRRDSPSSSRVARGTRNTPQIHRRMSTSIRRHR